MRSASRVGLFVLALALLSCRSDLERAIDSGDGRKISEALATPKEQARLAEQGSRWMLRALREGQPESVRALLSAGVVKADADIDGRSLLHHAMAIEDDRAAEAVIAVLKEHGAALARADAQGRTSLDEAIDLHRLHLVRALLGPSPDIRAYHGNPGQLLVASAKKGDAELVKLLVNAGAVLEDPAPIASIPDAVIQHLLELAHLQFRLQRAVDQGDFEAIQKLGTSVTPAQLEALGMTSAHIAALANDRKWLGDLLTDEETLAAVDRQGLGLLHYAALSGDPRTAAQLLKAGAALDARGKAGRTPLMLASEKGRAKMVAFLLEKGAAANAEDAEGHTALTLAARGGHAVTVSKLVASGAFLVRRRFIEQAPSPDMKARLEDAHAQFLLRWAAETGQKAGQARLVKQGESNVRMANGFDLTPHVVAILADDVPQLEAAVAKVPDTLDRLRKQTSGRTLLHWAALAGAEKCTAWLLDKGLPLEVYEEGRSSSESDSPLELAIAEGHVGVARLLVQHGAALWSTPSRVPATELEPLVAQARQTGKLKEAWRDHRLEQIPALLKAGAVERAVTSAPGAPAPSALTWRIFRGDALASLTRAEVDAEPPAGEGRTALHFAAAAANPAAVERLLALGLAANVQDQRHVTPAGFAARAGDVASLRLLLDARVDAVTLGEREPDAFERVLCLPSPEAALLLLSHGAPPSAKERCWTAAIQQAITDGKQQEAIALLGHWKPSAKEGLPSDLLKAAATSDRVEVVRWMLDNEGPGDRKFAEKALMAAARAGARATTALVLERGVPGDGAQYRLREAMLHAISARHSEVATLLLDGGADPMKTVLASEFAWSAGIVRPAPQYPSVAPVGLALARGDRAFIEHLAAKKPEAWKQLQAEPRYLAIAASGGFLDLVRGYVEAGADATGKGLPDGPLLGLAGSEEVAAYLLEHGGVLEPAAPTSATAAAAAPTSASAAAPASASAAAPASASAAAPASASAAAPTSAAAPAPASAAAPASATDGGGTPSAEPADAPETAFAAAARRGNFHVARFFLKKGARPRVEPVLAYLAPPRYAGDPEPELGPERLQALGALLQESAWTPEQRGELLEGIAARACDTPALLEPALAGLSSDAVATRARPALVHLAQCKDPRGLQALVQRGANLQATDAEGFSVLADALRAKNTGAVKALLALGVPASPATGDAFAYVQLAREQELPEVAQLLLEHVARGRELAPPQLDAALVLALQLRASEAAAQLLARGASAQATGAEGVTALSLALGNDWSWVANLFLELGATDPAGTALDVLLAKKNWAVAERLVGGGGVPPDTAAAHLLAAMPFGNGPEDGAESKLSLLRELAERKVEDFSTKNVEELLLLAARRDDLELAKLALERGKADANTSAGEGYTVLHTAAQDASLPLVELLVEHGSDVNAEGMECIRPLERARWRKDREGRKVAKFLQEQGAEEGKCGDPG